MTAYADVNDLVARHDIDVLGDLATDDRTRLSREDVQQPGNDPPGHPTIVMALASASGEIEASLAKGGRYTPQDLLDLTGNSEEYLKTLTCNLALELLLRRRPGQYLEMLERMSAANREAIDRIKNGEDVFGTLERHIEAGKPTVDGPSVATMEMLNTLPTRMHRYFPDDEQRLPRSQQHRGT